MQKSKNVKVGISIGDINGVGIEIIMKALSDNRLLENITPVIYGSARMFSYYKKAVNAHHFNYTKIEDAGAVTKKKVNLVNLWDEEIKISMGEATLVGGEYAYKSLEAATNDLAGGKVDVLITAPINKKTIQSDQFNFPGHTEYLTKLSNADSSLMFMVYDELRIGVATNHIPLNKVAEVLTTEDILQKIQLMNASLMKDFNIVKPKIAVLGLNPHAGENGMIGSEEIDVIKPAIEKAQQNDILAFGAYAADGFFGSGAYTQFDGILAMYHDQGLIPFKALAAGRGVNFTAGLPIVRTSPDHGTAYDIAGKGVADSTSFRNAIFLAVDVYRNRNFYKEITSNPLEIQKKR